MHDARRLLSFPSMFNVRDLGGYPTLDGGTTRWRSILRGDDPAQLTPQGLDAIAAAGITTIVDLRWPEEAAGSPSPIPGRLRNVRHHSISLLAGSATKWAEVCGEPPKETWITAVLKYSRPELVAVLRTIAAAPAEPVMFHCVAGKDRTGAVAAVLLALAGAEPEAIAYDYAASSDNLRDYYLRRYSNLTREEILEAVRCPPEGVYRMLEYLQDHGGIEAFLGSLGMTEAELVRLRSRLRD